MSPRRHSPQYSQQRSEQNELVESNDVRGISGRRVTVVVLLGLVLSGGCLVYLLRSYDKLDAARSATEESWRILVDPLSARYREVEHFVASGVDDRSIKMEFGEKFRLLVDRFRSTVQTAAQYDTARELESLLADQSFDAPLPNASEQVLAAIASHNKRLREQRTELSSPGGRILTLFLNFPELVEMQVPE